MNKLRTILATTFLSILTISVTECKPETIDSDVRVTTYAPQNITTKTARCGGDAIVTEGLSLNEFGVCWSTERNPSIEDAHLSTTNWREPFVCTITDLEPDTKYHIRAYALRGLEYYYGDDKSFTTRSNAGGGGWDNHAYINLGLPSGILWATCNVGADTPEGFGDYFSWGEILCKEFYSWDNYQFSNSGTSWENSKLIKYCNNANYGYNGFTDNYTSLLSGDDAATVNWGGYWRTPTKEEWQELLDNTTHIWTTHNGVNGMLFTANNGSSFFLPAAGSCSGSELYNLGNLGHYWSKSLNLDIPSAAWSFQIDGSTVNLRNDCTRIRGHSVRPVRDK